MSLTHREGIADSAQGLLFDLDGTLLDSVPDLSVAVDAMLQQSNLPLAGEQRVRTWVGEGANVLVERALRFAYACEPSQLDKRELQNHLQHFLAFYSECSGQHSRVYNGVLAALKAWHAQGKAMAIVTNKPQVFILPLLKRFQLSEYFSVCVGGDALVQCKPHPAPLLFACEQLGLSAGQCLMIGDSKTDVVAARAANMPIACVSYGYNHGEPIANARPDILVDSLEQLI